MSVLGIDVSENNGVNIDWRSVHSHGVRFVFMKVNEGDYFDKRTSHARIRLAREAGLLVGGYNFVRPRPGRTGAQEFDIFWKRARLLGLCKHGDLRPVIDIEATAFVGKLGPLRTRRYVRSWIKRCVQVTGKPPIVYTGKWFWDGPSMNGNKRGLRGARLWLAAYAMRPDPFVPAAWDHESFWQYTDRGTVPGISTPVDMNRYQSSFQNLKRGHTI